MSAFVIHGSSILWVGAGSTADPELKLHATGHDLEFAVIVELKFILYGRRNHKVISSKEMV